MDFNAIREQADKHFAENSEAASTPDQAENTQESAQETEQEAQAPIEDRAPSSTQKENDAAAIFDLSKAQKVLWEGKEYTLDQLKKERMLHADYTRKTQEFANERKQFEQQRELDQHFRADLPKVLSNPALLNVMAQHYPAEYVNLARQYLQLTPQEKREVAQEYGTSLDLQGVEKIIENRLKPIIEKFDQQEILGIQKSLDSTFDSLKTKYPGVNEKWVLSELQALTAQEGYKVTNEEIERVFKEIHDADRASKEAYHKEKLQEQSKANKKGRDIAIGGATPGTAPQRIKLKDARDAFLNSVMSRQG